LQSTRTIGLSKIDSGFGFGFMSIASGLSTPRRIDERFLLSAGRLRDDLSLSAK
jgi:hypothetical protein